MSGPYQVESVNPATGHKLYLVVGCPGLWQITDIYPGDWCRLVRYRYVLDLDRPTEAVFVYEQWNDLQVAP